MQRTRIDSHQKRGAHADAGARPNRESRARALSSFTSGLIVSNAGWEKVNLAALPLIGIVLVAIVWLWLMQRAVRPAGA